MSMNCPASSRSRVRSAARMPITVNKPQVISAMGVGKRIGAPSTSPVSAIVPDSACETKS